MIGKVVHCKKARYDVYVGRPSKWGNPFRSGRDGTREQVIARYEEWLDRQPDLLADLPSLAGLTLACWCSPLACHADVLARRAEQAAVLARRAAQPAAPRRVDRYAALCDVCLSAPAHEHWCPLR